MKPTNEVKTEVGLMAVTLLLSVGVAVGGQWLFDKCFGEETTKVEKVSPKSQCDSVKNIDSVYLYKSQMQKQK